ncbi:MAG TPA: HAD family hydrolase [Pyrinomonadaceae bacterium]|jgi:phosphoglycolate phosphatase-like HAD superfamily hydrolase
MKLVIFDIDGTLTNTNDIDDACFVKALEESHGITEISTDWAEYPHTTDSGITQFIFQERFRRNPVEKELSKFKSRFVDLLNVEYRANALNFTEIAGASVALERLKQDATWAVAIATGSWRGSALLKLKAAGVEVDGMAAAYADDGLSREEILQVAARKALEQYRQSEFEKIVSVGDGVWDVRVAGRLGFAFLGIGDGDAAAKLRQAGAKHIIKDFTDYELFAKGLEEADVPVAERFQ